MLLCLTSVKGKVNSECQGHLKSIDVSINSWYFLAWSVRFLQSTCLNVERKRGARAVVFYSWKGKGGEALVLERKEERVYLSWKGKGKGVLVLKMKREMGYLSWKGKGRVEGYLSWKGKGRGYLYWKGKGKRGFLSWKGNVRGGYLCWKGREEGTCPGKERGEIVAYDVEVGDRVSRG